MQKDIIIQGDCRDNILLLEDKSVHCIVSSPPYYGLRNYGMAAQMGLEATPEAFVTGMVELFRMCREKLRDDGTLWLNIGDSYATTSLTPHAGQRKNRDQSAMSGMRRSAEKIGLKPKDLIGIPWMLALALRADGWYLRQDIIWHKTTCMPESVRDRCTKNHEYLFLLSKSQKYYFDHKAIMEPITAASIVRLRQNIDEQAGSERAHAGTKSNGAMKAVMAKGNRKTFRGGGKYTKGQSFDNSAVVENESVGNAPNETDMRNKRSVWSIAPAQFKEAHFATFPEALITDCIKAGSPEGGVILDPFMGAGTTALVAKKLNRHYIGFELNPEYIAIAEERLSRELGLFK